MVASLAPVRIDHEIDDTDPGDVCAQEEPLIPVVQDRALRHGLAVCQHAEDHPAVGITVLLVVDPDDRGELRTASIQADLYPGRRVHAQAVAELLAVDGERLAVPGFPLAVALVALDRPATVLLPGEGEAAEQDLYQPHRRRLDRRRRLGGLGRRLSRDARRRRRRGGRGLGQDDRAVGRRRQRGRWDATSLEGRTGADQRHTETGFTPADASREGLPVPVVEDGGEGDVAEGESQAPTCGDVGPVGYALRFDPLTTVPFLSRAAGVHGFPTSAERSALR